jgi:hypothetical protein
MSEGIYEYLLILLKNLPESFDGARTNGSEIEIVEHNPFMLSLVEAFFGFFSRIIYSYLTLRVLRELLRKRCFIYAGSPSSVISAWL